jgi:class 3 adenylate cyclase
MPDETATPLDPLDQLRLLDYRVEQSQEVEGVAIFFIEGHGVTTYAREDDADTLSSLLDSHDERVAQLANPAETGPQGPQED